MSKARQKKRKATRSEKPQETPDELFQLGNSFWEAGKHEAARNCYAKVLQMRPSFTDVLNDRGNLFQNEKKFEAAIPLYEQALRLHPDYLPALGNLAGILREMNRPKDAIERYAQALRVAPTDARLWLGLGLSHSRLRQLGEAVVCYQEALRLRAGHPETLFNLGNTLLEQGKFEGALGYYSEALRVRPTYAEVYRSMGICWRKLDDLQQAVRCFETALSHKPDYVDALHNLGAALRDLERKAEACAKFESALQLAPNNATLISDVGSLFYAEGKVAEALEYHNRALVHEPQCQEALAGKSLALLALGEYREGWKLYESGLGHPNKRGIKPFGAAISWDGEPAPDKHVLIWHEQGLGDALQFIRYAELCKQRVGRVSVLCRKPLARLFKALPFIDNVFDATDTIDFGGYEHAMMMSLPHLFDTTLQTVPACFPYLRVDPEVQMKWAAKFTEHTHSMKIGLVWAGSSHKGHIIGGLMDRQRSVTLERLMPWLDLQGTTFYSLQKDKPAEQITELGIEGRLINYMDDVSDFADTAAVVQNLDLIITVDTSVAHLAGGLGKPVWILSRFNADWRWLQNRPTNPWYPTARIFGQPTLGDWDSVIADVGRELAKEIATKSHDTSIRLTAPAK